MKLTNQQTWNAIYLFLRKLWNLDPQKYAGHGIGLGAILSFCCSHWEDDYEWRRICLLAFKKPWPSEDISPNDTLRLAQSLIVRYQNKYGFDLSVTYRLLQEMASAPSLHKNELLAWQESLQEAGKGIERKSLKNYHFLDWAG
jgi:hypothetical protein